eukprot:4852846-Lingulodinium_polyedra.AAC.1
MRTAAVLPGFMLSRTPLALYSSVMMAAAAATRPSRASGESAPRGNAESSTKVTSAKASGACC